MPDRSPASNSLPLEICALCAIGCNLNDTLTSRCTRRNHWLAATSPSQDSTSYQKNLIANLRLDAQSLIWLDACDVKTARAAIAVAQQTGATIHVGKSTGADAVKRVMFGGSWFGTTLAEVAPRADLIITIGDGVLSESPLLADRFFTAKSTSDSAESNSAQSNAAQWIHISPHAAITDRASQSLHAPSEHVHWPRALWFEKLSELALSLKSNANNNSLSQQLKSSQQTVWLWDVDDFHFQTDELIIRRIVSIASELNQAARCTLLPLDMNIGRVTAEETLLWLTGCPGTATWRDGRWYRSPRLANFTLEQWAAEFSNIVLISNLPSDRALPNLPAQLVLQSNGSNAANTIQVAAVGRDCSGHLFRGDRGTVHFVQATRSNTLPMATDVLTQLLRNSRTEDTELKSSSEAKRAH